MINWISSEDEKDVRTVDYVNLCRIMNFVNKQKSDDEMVRYVCQIFDEYRDILSTSPILLRDSLRSFYGDNFIVDGSLEQSDAIVSPSDLNAYYTLKKLNSNKKNLAVVCFDLHSDTYDYNDFLWKGNSFSKLLKEGYVNHYIVIGVPKHKRQMCIEDTNEDLRDRVHLIDSNEVFVSLIKTHCDYAFISIDADCFNCRKSRYTSVEYSPYTILNYVSHIENIDKDDFVNKIHDCVHVKNELGYSNYYHTGENDLSVDDVINIINDILIYCKDNDIKLNLTQNAPYFQLMEVSGYDYCNLTTKMVVKLIDNLSLKEVRKNGKIRVLKKN